MQFEDVNQEGPFSENTECIFPIFKTVGLHTSISYSCQCPASIEYRWMEGPKVCSFHPDWQAPNYFADKPANLTSKVASWRFEPPEYYANLHCEREGTLDVGYICVDAKGQLTKGFVSPHCRKAEYCVCKPMYYGARCEKVCEMCVLYCFYVLDSPAQHLSFTIYYSMRRCPKLYRVRNEDRHRKIGSFVLTSTLPTNSISLATMVLDLGVNRRVECWAILFHVPKIQRGR